MFKRKYDFSENGINAMYNDSLETIYSVLNSKNCDALLEKQDINISIGNKKVTVPICADAFEMLFDFLREAEKEENL